MSSDDLVKRTSEDIKWMVKRVSSGNSTVKQASRIYGVTERRVQQLVKIYRDTVEVPTLNPKRSSSFTNSEEEEAVQIRTRTFRKFGGRYWHTTFSKIRGEGFGEEVKRRIILGTYALSAGYYGKYYLKALKVRTLIKREFEDALKMHDILAMPTMPLVAFKLGERIKDPLSLYLADENTVSVNLAGVPSISIPCGFSNGLPIGLQIVGKHFEEDRILKAAFGYEQEGSWEIRFCVMAHYTKLYKHRCRT